MKLALGTAQFGLNYGVSNQNGQVPLAEARSILKHAWEVGIRTIDTAISYGNSESRLGELGVSGWEMITKLPEVPLCSASLREWLRENLEGSFTRLGVPSIHGLLLHRPMQLLESGGEGLFRQLCEFKEEGLVKKIGVSVYGPEELEQICPHFPIDLVQAPYNVLDQTLATSGWLDRLHQQGTEVHVRSVFLQGLLLMPVARRPKKFSRWSETWRIWDAWLESSNQTALQACIRFPLANNRITKVVTGIESVEQLQEIIGSADGSTALVPEALQVADPDLINPARWSRL